MEIDVTFEKGEPVKIFTDEYGEIAFKVEGSSAVYQWSAPEVTAMDAEKVAREIEMMPFIQAVKVWDDPAPIDDN